MKRAVIEALRQLEVNGKLTAEDVVEAAKDEDSPLHEHFEWDEGVAAAKWRLEQGRQLIRAVEFRLVVGKTTTACPNYIRDPDSPQAQQGYVAIAKVKGPSAKAALQAELAIVEAYLSRAEKIAAVLRLAPEVRAIQRRVHNLREKVTAHA